MTDDKASAYTTLYTVLVTLAKLTAPYTPFVSEMIYQNLVPSFYKDAPLSVHLCKFPEAEEKFIDKNSKTEWTRFWTSSFWAGRQETQEI